VTPEDDLAGLGQFRLRTSRNWLGPGKSSSVISPFSASHLPEFLGWEECSGRFLMGNGYGIMVYGSGNGNDNDNGNGNGINEKNDKNKFKQQ
jgi:hypothetical protein